MNVYKIPSDVSVKDIQKVPSMENYEGLALATTADVDDVDKFELGKLLNGKAVVFNSSNTIFVFNCAHALWQNKTYKNKSFVTSVATMRLAVVAACGATGGSAVQQPRTSMGNKIQKNLKTFFSSRYYFVQI